MNPIKKTITLADGRTITLETGKLAKQADGAVELRMGNTMLLATVVSAKEAGEGVDSSAKAAQAITKSLHHVWLTACSARCSPTTITPILS